VNDIFLYQPIPSFPVVDDSPLTGAPTVPEKIQAGFSLMTEKAPLAVTLSVML
jgi:hypothetical protein